MDTELSYVLAFKFINRRLVSSILCLSSIIIGNPSFGQNSLEVSGIIQDVNRPIAIVDGQVVKEGDRIGDISVKKIEASYVIFQDSNGNEIQRELQAADPAPVVPPENYIDNDNLKNLHDEASDIADQADKYFRLAQEIEKKKVLSVDLYEQALIYYSKAINQAHLTLGYAQNERAKQIMMDAIYELRERKNKLTNRKDEFLSALKKARLKKYVILGMTKEDVIKSIGRPMRVNKDVGAYLNMEQWIYGDFGPYYYFEGGILTSMQK